MTRASLLHILDNLGGISETQVQELEQLAATFPYCQTAHLLLAKAAHDRGSMLAAQRLRRAATYAVDRQRLRELIELPAPLPPAQLVAPADATRVEMRPVLLESNSPTANVPVVDTELVQEADWTEVGSALDTTNTELEQLEGQSLDVLDRPAESQTDEVASGAAHGAREADLVVLPVLSEEMMPEQGAAENAPQPDTVDATFDVAPPLVLAEATTAKEEQVDTTLVLPSEEKEVLSESEALSNETFDEIQTPSALEPQSETKPDPAMGSEPEEDKETLTPALNESTAESASSGLEVVTAPAEDELPLIAPPIRTPAEVGSSRFEFGLMEPLPTAMPTYNLFEVEKVSTKKNTVIPPFWADEEVGYASGMGSRLGFCLQMQNEYTLDLPPSAFFEPDALLLQHLKQHKPIVPPVPKSIDLIDKFLRSKPRFKAPLPLPPTTEAQADLSVQSTVAEPGLASESLARILARQGKIAKAIEIYERLIVRQPEKKAYFADQIQQLKTFE